ncbi:MAG: alpha-amylase family glycosyl hydrolase, partial [Treponema sp.]|nr:alpha-amylase family glycosyl hydrolase [Treponema sp.]
SSPNNWTGFFGNDVWEFDESSRLYYLHLFDKKQPDLNHKNPAVTEEVKKIMRFWLDRGASGFRCDVINIIYKTDLEDGRKSIAVRGLEHYKSQEGNHRILRELRRDVLDHYDCFTVGETVMVDLPEAKLLSDRERGELDMLFYFEHLEIDRRIARFIPKKFNASRLLEVLTKWQQGLEWNAVYLENHDQPRIVSHFGSVRYKSGRLDRILTSGKTGSDALEYWKRSAKMLALLELTLRGTVFIYQGQEIGMTNYNFRSLDEVNDVESHNLDKLMKKMHIPSFLRLKWIRESCRDNGRTPMQWNGQAYAGFSKVKPWLPVNPNYPFLNYASQKDDPDSILYFYRKLIGIRKNSDCLKSAGFDPIYADSRVMAYRRKSGSEVYLVVLNFSFRRIKLPKKIMAQIPGKAELFISTAGRTITDSTLLPWEGILVKNSY